MFSVNITMFLLILFLTLITLFHHPNFKIWINELIQKLEEMTQEIEREIQSHSLIKYGDIEEELEKNKEKNNID